MTRFQELTSEIHSIKSFTKYRHPTRLGQGGGGSKAIKGSLNSEKRAHRSGHNWPRLIFSAIRPLLKKRYLELVQEAKGHNEIPNQIPDTSLLVKDALKDIPSVGPTNQPFSIYIGITDFTNFSPLFYASFYTFSIV